MKDFTIIGQPNCPWCDKAKALIEAQGYTYDYVDIGQEVAVKTFMARIGWLTVPVVLGNYEDEPWPLIIGGYSDLEKWLPETAVKSSYTWKI